MGTWMGKGDMQARVRIAGLSKNVLSLGLGIGWNFNIDYY